MSYPPEIRERVDSLSQYKNSIKNTEKGHIVKKLIAVAVFIVLLAAVAYFSGARNFQTAFLHVFILFFAVNLFDVLVLDIGVFCHSKKLRIAGTEDMDREYKNYLNEGFLAPLPQWLENRRVCLVDASDESKPGSKGADYRLHYLVE